MNHNEVKKDYCNTPEKRAYNDKWQKDNRDKAKQYREKHKGKAKIQRDKRYKTKEGMLARMYNAHCSRLKKKGFKPPNYTFKGLCDWCFKQPIFHKLYDEWVKSGYQRRLKPSVDRRDNKKGYFFDNMELMTVSENCSKSALYENCIPAQRERIRVLEKENEELKKYEALTPQGSEFANNPQNVYDYIKHRLDNEGVCMKEKVRLKRELSQKNAEIERQKEVIRQCGECFEARDKELSRYRKKERREKLSNSGCMKRWWKNRKPWEKTYWNIQNRCNAKDQPLYKKEYGKTITIKDLKYLWNRDKAENLKRPSIDRIDSTKGYSKENCRYIENYHNNSRAHYNRPNPIHQYTKEGVFLKEWINPQRVKDELGVAIYDCLLGNYKTAGGFVWKYKNGRSLWDTRKKNAKNVKG